MPDERSKRPRIGPGREPSHRLRRCAMVTAAALCSVAVGLRFELPTLFGTLHFAQTDRY